MTTRNEPTVTNVINIAAEAPASFEFGGLFSKKASKTPDQLVKDALQGFTDAQAKLEAVQSAIAVQKAEHEAEIEKRQRLLDTATESHSRLERIKGRFADLLA